MDHLDALKILEAELDKYYLNFDAIRFSPESILPHLYLIVDFRSLRVMDNGFSRNEYFLTHESHRALYDALDQAVLWIKDAKGTKHFAGKPSEIKSLQLFFQHAYDYRNLVDIHWDAYNGLCNVECDLPKKTARFFYAPEHDKKVLDISLVSFQDTNRELDFNGADKQPASLISWVSSNLLFTDGYFASVQGSALSEASEYFFRIRPSDLPGHWQLMEQYTIEQARKIYVAWELIAAKYLSILQSRQPQETFSILKRQTLIDFAAKVTSISTECVAAFLTDMTYGNDVKKPTVWLQPFLQLDEESMLMQCGMINLASHERNITKLVSRMETKKKSYDRLKNQKESLFIDEIKDELGSIGWRFAEGIKVPKKDDHKATDIDLLIWTDEGEESAILELKWPIPVDEISEILAADKEMEKGCLQVRAAVNWIENYPEEVADKIRGELAAKNLKYVHGFVLNYSSYPSHLVNPSDVVVGSYTMFKKALNEAEDTSFKALFEEMQKGPNPDRGEVGEDQTEFHDVKIGDLTYICPTVTPKNEEVPEQ